jgi:hypothetical protein
MEINLKKLSQNAIENSSGNVVKMRLSEDASSMVFQLFTKSVYSNPIGTVVREITSNCFDSHIEAQVNAPVVIKKHKDSQTGQLYISFIDYGVGMSPDRVENIYGVYFESTKRVDNTQIGGFGIGAKSILAYKRSTGQGEGEYDNSFYVITIFDKMKYFYCIYEGAESPVISLLHSEETTERNGTEIQIPVLEKDVDTFTKEMVKQLYYFENIVFQGFENDYRNGETLSNEYQIIRGKSFLFRGSEYSSNVHVCLGRVAYPIDFSILGLNSSDYRLPIALRLEVGDINVTVSRESLDYSEGTIKMLKKKLEIAVAEIRTLITKQYEDIRTLEQYFLVNTDFGKLVFSNGASLYVGDLIKQKDIDFQNFKYQFMKMTNDKQLFRFFFNTNSYGKKPKRSRYSDSSYEFEGGYKELKNKSNLLFIEGEFNRKVVKQAYLKATHELYHIIGLRNLTDNSIRHDIAEIFNVHLDKTCDDNGKPVNYVQSLIDMQEEYFTIVQRYAKNYDTIEIPEDFVASRKRQSGITSELRNTTIPIKFIGGNRSKLRVKLDQLFKFNSTIFYGTEEDESQLREIQGIFSILFPNVNVVSNYDTYNDTFDGRNSSKSGIMFIMLAKNNIKYMDFCKKAYKPSEFFSKILYRKADAVQLYFQTYELVEKYNEVKKLYKEDRFAEIDATWGKKIVKLKACIIAIPETSRNTSIGSMKYVLSKYFDLSIIKQTAQQKKLDEMINEILSLQVANEKILSYIDMPYCIKDADSEFITILKKIMAL